MSQPQAQTIQLPPILKFIIPAQHAAIILAALENHGPYKDVNPAIMNFQQQLLGQQVLPAPVAPPPAVDRPPAIEAAEDKYPAASRAPYPDADKYSDSDA